MKNATRYFAVKLHKGGNLELCFFFSYKERQMFCDNKENHARPITWKQWKEIPQEMKIKK